MTDQVDRVIAGEFAHVKPGFLKVLNDGFNRDIAQREHSPLWCARANYADYIEHVGESAKDMEGYIMAVMGPWRDGFEENGMPGLVEKLVHSRVSDWQLDMQMAGMQLMGDRSEELAAADNLWRIQHPDQATLEPLD
jgi:hypothetical protein